jgi:hypothetical protein
MCESFNNSFAIAVTWWDASVFILLLFWGNLKTNSLDRCNQTFTSEIRSQSNVISFQNSCNRLRDILKSTCSQHSLIAKKRGRKNEKEEKNCVIIELIIFCENFSKLIFIRIQTRFAIRLSIIVIFMVLSIREQN